MTVGGPDRGVKKLSVGSRAPEPARRAWPAAPEERGPVFVSSRTWTP